MGILRFAKWLRERYTDHFVQIRPSFPASNQAPTLGRIKGPDNVHVMAENELSFDYVLVDMNGILHPALSRCSHLEWGIKRLTKDLNRVLKYDLKVRPQSELYLSVDGPGPLAKMELQRHRRSKPPKDLSLFDNRMITPGCTLMTEIDHILGGYAVQYLYSNRRKPWLRVTVDGSGVPGEGEIKIIRKIKDTIQKSQRLRKKPTFGIIGADTDILLQCLVAHFKTVTVIRSNRGEIFRVGPFIDDVTSELPNRNPVGTMIDFSFLAMFLGTDYLPAVRYTSLTLLWDKYRQLVMNDQSIGYLVSTRGKSFSLNVDLLLRILDEEFPAETLAKQMRLKAMAQKAQTRSEDVSVECEVEEEVEPVLDESNSVPEDEDEVKTPFDAQSISNYYYPTNEAFDFAPLDVYNEAVLSLQKPVDINKGGSLNQHEKAMRYLYGFLWCTEMYRKGECQDFLYTYPYRDAPTRQELVDFLKSGQKLSLSQSHHHEIIPLPRKQPLPGPVCAALILPKDCAPYLDPPFRSLLSLYHAYQANTRVVPYLVKSHKSIVAHYASRLRLDHANSNPVEYGFGSSWQTDLLPEQENLSWFKYTLMERHAIMFGMREPKFDYDRFIFKRPLGDSLHSTHIRQNPPSSRKKIPGY